MTGSTYWRPVSKEQLFEPSPLGASEAATPANIVSYDIMRRLATTGVIEEEKILSLAYLLTDGIIGTREDPLPGLADLTGALHADYCYYRADRHLEGFCEGMVYGMTRLARIIMSELGKRPESFFPDSVLAHPDVLLATFEANGMTADEIAKATGRPDIPVAPAIVGLMTERLIAQSIYGTTRYFFPTTRGQGHAERLRAMLAAACDDSPDDGKVADRVMGLAGFHSRDAVLRAIAIMRGHGDYLQGSHEKPASPASPSSREQRRNDAIEEALDRIWPFWFDGSATVDVTISVPDIPVTHRTLGKGNDLIIQDILLMLAIQDTLERHGLGSDTVADTVRVEVHGTSGLNAYEDDVTCDMTLSDGSTIDLRIIIAGSAIPSYTKPLDEEIEIEELLFERHEATMPVADDPKEGTTGMTPSIIQSQVETMLAECIGDDSFMEDESYETLNFREEYDLDIYAFVDIVKALGETFGLDVSPTQLEWDDIDTVKKLTALVERMREES